MNSKLKLSINSNTEKKANISIINKNFVNNNNYTDYEINSLSYKEALNIDHRSYCEYYLSLLKTKHLLIFSFYTKNDYNSRMTKIIIFVFSFALLYAINSLFFQDSTIHKIYEDNGTFDFIYQLPQIIYSTLISSVITLILKYLGLTDKTIIKIKTNNDIEKISRIVKWIKIRFIILFLMIFLLLILFWYYLSCFCAVYKNTQIHLLKDTLISFGLSLVYPLGLNLLPGFLRIPALKKLNNQRYYLYSISKIIQQI